MLKIEVNNGRKIVLESRKNGVEVFAEDHGGGIDYSYIIPEGEIVMLLNYYRNCKNGMEKSDYIHPGKIVNTNIITDGKHRDYL